MKPRLAQLHQSGATDRQGVLWDNVAGYWIPAKFVEDVTTTKGDILARTATVVARLGVGADGQVLTADAASALGLKWATAAAVPTHARDLTTAYAPLTTDIAGVPDLVWDADNSLILTEVPIP